MPTIAELRANAKALGIKRYSKMKKSELEECIAAAEQPADAEEGKGFVQQNILAEQPAEPARKRKKHARPNAVGRAPNNWAIAVKEFNEGRDSFIIPRKGTADHAEVIKIMERLKLEKK